MKTSKDLINESKSLLEAEWSDEQELHLTDFGMIRSQVDSARQYYLRKDYIASADFLKTAYNTFGKLLAEINALAAKK